MRRQANTENQNFASRPAKYSDSQELATVRLKRSEHNGTIVPD